MDNNERVDSLKNLKNGLLVGSSIFSLLAIMMTSSHKNSNIIRSTDEYYKGDKLVHVENYSECPEEKICDVNEHIFEVLVEVPANYSNCESFDINLPEGYKILAILGTSSSDKYFRVFFVNTEPVRVVPVRVSDSTYNYSKPGRVIKSDTKEKVKVRK